MEHTRKEKSGIPGPILYLHEYKHVPEEILLTKNDEDLSPWTEDVFTESDLPARLCIGIGTYRTKRDGEIYLCALIEPVSCVPVSWAFGVYRSAELADRALQRLFAMYDAGKPNEVEKAKDAEAAETPEALKAPKAASEPALILRSSRNPVYRTRLYREITAKYPVRTEMTEPGTRGGVMAVSTFFSRLMIRKGGYEFMCWQDAVDWISRYIFEGLMQRDKSSAKTSKSGKKAEPERG
ncbi:MAG: hypothetical protein ACI4LA_02530 [Emergencia sp.]